MLIVMERRIGAAKFKEQCLALLEEIGPEGIVITKHNKPIARLTPIRRDARNLIGSLKGKIRIQGDITTTSLAWHAES